MSKHTPGPWNIAGDGQTESSCRIIDDENRFVLRLEGMDYGRDEDQANARLIAAAPDLLAALHELAEIGEGGVIERRETGKPTWSALEAVATIARAAIAKAEQQ